MFSTNYKKIGKFLLTSFAGICMSAMIFAQNASTDVTVSVDTAAKTAVMANEYFTMKFEQHGTCYSMVDNKTGKEIIGPAKGCYLSVNGGDGFTADSVSIVTDTPDMADLSYKGAWGEIHYVLRRGISGFYSYFVVSELKNVGEFRTLYRFDGSIFRNGYVSAKQGALPELRDVTLGTKLQDETWKLPSGTIYSKYDWADYEQDDLMHGVYGNGYGAWMIPISPEYYTSGPMREELMVHLESRTGDAVLLNMLKGSHFGVPAMTIPSGYIYGPWLVYINNGDIDDAKSVASKQEWPCSWLNNSSYPLQRSVVSGKLSNADSKQGIADAQIVLAQPGGDIYIQNGYIFTAKTDSSGQFKIPYVRAGSYTLYAYMTTGTYTTQFEKDGITVQQGKDLDLSEIDWKQNSRKILWSIGTADRRSGEFKLGNMPRQYGLFDKVPADLDYTIGKSVPAKDWYYAQTQPGSWNILFTLDTKYKGSAYLEIPVAGVSLKPDVEILVNGHSIKDLNYTTENDAGTYRNAMQSSHWRDNEIEFPASYLKKGNNIITLNMKSVQAKGGVMYDIIELQVPENN